MPWSFNHWPKASKHIHELLATRFKKRWAHDRRTLRGFEKGLAQEITLCHLHSLFHAALDKAGLGVGSAPKRKTQAASEAFANAHGLSLDGLKVSREFVTSDGSTIFAGDVALVHLDGVVSVAEILFHASVGGGIYSCISPWEAAGRG